MRTSVCPQSLGKNIKYTTIDCIPQRVRDNTSMEFQEIFNCGIKTEEYLIVLFSSGRGNTHVSVIELEIQLANTTMII